MKYINLITLISYLILSTGCKEDAAADFTSITLNYDGVNDTSPTLLASTYESGVVFPFGFDGNDEGNELYAVSIYIKEIPTTAVLRVYAGDNFEGNIVYEKSVLSEIGNENWFTHALDTPVLLTGNDFWITLRYEQQDLAQVLGCDSGPGVIDSNWHYDVNDNLWIPFNDRFGADINWNIRALVRVADEI